jgi:endonuclease YncB( thermonuclease family)
VDIKENKKSNGSWVFWLTGIFVIMAIFVFTVAIMRIQEKKSDASFEVTNRNLNENPIPELGKFRVVRIIDGDGLIIIGSDEIELNIRLAGIDAPEINQPFGIESKESLETLIGNRLITMDDPKKGKYGRYIANVFVEEVWINREMVATGYAWYDKINSSDYSLQLVEKEARGKALGIWRTVNPIPPWEWRSEN